MVQQSSFGRLQTCSGFLDTFPDVQLAEDTFPPFYRPPNARGRADWAVDWQGTLLPGSRLRCMQ